MSTFDLDRFKQAQDHRQPGFSDAVRELRTGRKTGHWIWYVFPQLAGLGHSPMASRFGLDGAGEAAAYLRDPVLCERLILASAAVRAQVAPDGGEAVSLERLMGSDIDALKLVSSMTLFRHLSASIRVGESDARPELATLSDHAAAILAAAAAEGYPPCSFTEQQLGVARD